MSSHSGLKLTAISMGVVLLGCIIFVFATIFHRVTGTGDGTLSEALAACPAESELALPAGAMVLAFETVGHTTRYLLGFKDGSQELLTAETCDSKVLQRVRFRW